MPNIDNLSDTIQQSLNTSASQETACFSTLDLKYAYSQLKLDPERARHCNFHNTSGERTGTYRFISGFYGLTDMPAAFQKVMDYTLVGLQNTYCFLEDIIVVSRGSKEDHLKLVYKCLKKLDEDNLRIKLPKCHFAKTEIEWLGHKFSQSGIAPLESKTAAIASLSAPNNLKQLRSFLGSVLYLGKFIPNLSQLCHPLRPLLKRNTKSVWNTEHQNHFQAIKNKVANATENTHYNPHLETRIKCDASRAGLGAALEQRSPTGWHTVAFASRFLNSNEERYSVNELELLGAFWFVEYFKYYLLGKSFTFITDHRALLSIMKEHRSNKSYNSGLTRWIDCLLPFDFNIEHIPGAKMGLVDYISRQPNQEAKVTNKYDEEFAVATITRFRDAIAAIFVNTTPQNCQSQHINSVTHTYSTRASHPRLTNYSNLLSALNRNTNKLLLENSANAALLQSSSNNTSNSTSIPTRSEIPTHASHIHTFSTNTMSNITSNPQTPPTHSRVTVQSTPNSAVNTTRSSNEGQNSPNLDLSKEEIFENNLTQLFTKGFLAVLTSKDAVLKEVRDCILKNDPQRCKEVNPYMYSYWRDLHVRSGCVCIDERVAIPHSIQDAVLQSLHLTHPGSRGMITLGQYAFRPYMHREILNKAAQCKPCTDIGKNLKPVVPASKWKQLQTCTEPNEEIQVDFGGPVTNEKDHDIYFLACIDRFSKFPTVEVFDKANGQNVLKFLDDYFHIHGVPRNIILDQARCLIGNKLKTFCKQHNINILTAPANDHRAIGLVEGLIQTIKRRLSCMKLDNRNHSFTTKEAKKSIVYHLRICKQKTTNVTPFQAHFGRKPNTPLSNISTVPKSSNL